MGSIKKSAIICDLDGTLCDVQHRRHYALQKNWKAFYEGIDKDQPRQNVIDILNDYKSQGMEILFVSGRPETHREKTVQWLSRFFPQYSALLMRSSSDHRDDDVIKQEIYDKHISEYFYIHTAIDDRPRVIRMWRRNNIEVIDVGDGVEF